MNELQQLRRAALDMQARREHSQAELRHKLSAKTSSQELINEILADFQQRNWQSDQRFTENFVNFRVAKGFGPMKIQAELRMKGIDDNLANRMIYSGEHDWSQLAQNALAKKFKTGTIDAIKQKRFLLTRGFTYEVINELVQS